MDFEKSMKRLEEIVESLEVGNIPLEESVKLYEEGMKLSKECQDKLSKAERKIYILKNGVEADQEVTTKKKKDKDKDQKDLNQYFDLFDVES